jgi:hypothetical protein
MFPDFFLSQVNQLTDSKAIARFFPNNKYNNQVFIIG